MKNLFAATLFTRSLQPAHANINDILRRSIADQIERLIDRYPDCPISASAEVDQLLQTNERLGGEQCL